MHAIGSDLLVFLLTAHKYKKFAFVNEKLSYFRAHKGSISIQSKNGKLPLHYNLVSAYFVENYRLDLIEKLNTFLFIGIKRFSDAKKYKLDKIENYYSINKNYKINITLLSSRIIKKIFKALKGN